MSNTNSIQWLNESEVILRFIERLVNELDELREHLMVLHEGDVLFEQGEPLEYLYLLLEGEVKLTRVQADDSEVVLINLKPGSFAGLIAFTTGEPTLTTGRITKKGLALKMKPTEFEQYLSDHPRLKHPLQQLMLNNMLERYKSNLRHQTKTHLLNKQLNTERDELRAAYQELEETHQMMVHKEKMATLGELVAGFAHEVNNPASALLRSAENLIEMYTEFGTSDPTYQLFLYGLDSEPMGSAVLRKKMRETAPKFPEVSERALLRKLAQMPKEAHQVILNQQDTWPLKDLINHFEAGKLIQNIRLSGTRIANLVKSLKSYSRQDQNKREYIDIREGLKDTILVLSSRLKFIDLDLQLNDIPKTCMFVGDLNQVWTNIIANACDAMEETGTLRISTQADDECITVTFTDSGTGISEEHLPNIFNADFTTKEKGEKFGLGIGLAITKEIISQAGGTITAKNNERSGATFTVTLPICTDCV